MSTPRYFSPVAGHKVNRFGTATTTSNNAPFGYTAHPETGVLTWDEQAVLMISAAEADRFPREYDRLVRDGALIEKTEADFTAYQKARAKGHAEAKRARDAAATPAVAEPAPALETPAPAREGKAPRVVRSPA